MPRIGFATGVLIALLLASVESADAAVGVIRSKVNVGTESLGQLAPDAAIEFIGTDPSFQLGYGAYSMATGLRLGTLLLPMNTAQATRRLVDLDGDGVSDVLGFYQDDMLLTTTVSLQHYAGGAFTRVFPDVVLGDVNVSFVGTMHLNDADPAAMVLLSNREIYILGQTGVLRYDSSADGSFPSVGTGDLSAIIDDFDGNGFDEVCVLFAPSVPGQPWNVILGDTSPSVGVGDPPAGALVRLLPSRPNPASGAARIVFETTRPADVQLKIYDASGRLVSRLADGPMPAGQHDRLWDGRDLAGRSVGSGVYFYELVVDGVKESRKLVQMR